MNRRVNNYWVPDAEAAECRASVTEGARFAADSPLEGNEFELSVPGRETVKPSWETGLLSRKRERICWGTEGSNPSPSSAESGANRDWHFFELSQRGHAGLIRHESLPARRSITIGLLTGTEGSNPVPSSGESPANLTSS